MKKRYKIRKNYKLWPIGLKLMTLRAKHVLPFQLHDQLAGRSSPLDHICYVFILFQLPFNVCVGPMKNARTNQNEETSHAVGQTVDSTFNYRPRPELGLRSLSPTCYHTKAHKNALIIMK